MTAPSTPTEPSETRAHTFAVGDKVVAAVDITEDMAFNRRRAKGSHVWARKGDQGTIVEDSGPLPFRFDHVVRFDQSDAMAVKAAWLSPAAPVPPERDDDDVIDRILTRLEAEYKAASDTADIYMISGLERALYLVRDIAGRRVP